MYVKTQNLTLQPIREQDLPALLALLRDDVVKQTYMVPDFPDHGAAETLARRIMTLSQDPDRYVAGIYREGQFVGLLNETERSGNSIELGYALLPDFHNRGYCTQALQETIQYLFTQGFGEVLTGAFADNTASIRVMEKSGMTPLARQEEVTYRGQTHRCVYYHAIKAEV